MTTHLHLVLRLRISGDQLPLPLRTFTARTGTTLPSIYLFTYLFTQSRAEINRSSGRIRMTNTWKHVDGTDGSLSWHTIPELVSLRILCVLTGTGTRHFSNTPQALAPLRQQTFYTNWPVQNFGTFYEGLNIRALGTRTARHWLLFKDICINVYYTRTVKSMEVVVVY